MPISSWRRRTRFKICAWIVTSSAVVGSSAISSDGLQDRARAITPAGACRPTSGADSRRCGWPRPGSRPAPASCARPSASLRPIRSCSITISAIWSPTVNSGLGLVIGSWKIIAISRPRIRRIAFLVDPGEVVDGARPVAEWIEPPTIRPGSASSRMMLRLVTDLQAGLAHHGQGLAALERETHSVHRLGTRSRKTKCVRRSSTARTTS